MSERYEMDDTTRRRLAGTCLLFGPLFAFFGLWLWLGIGAATAVLGMALTALGFVAATRWG